MTLLYGKKFELALQVSDDEGILIKSEVGPDGQSGLDLRFDVQRSLSREPNTCEVSIWNLQESTRASLSERSSGLIILHAGYSERASLIFRGDLRETRVERDGDDIITTVEAGDGERAHRSGRVSRSFNPGTALADGASQVAEAMGVERGNIDAVRERFGFEAVSDTLSGGGAVFGRASRHLDNFARAAGMEYSIQDGKLQFLTRGQALPGEAVLLSPDSGLIGSPTRSSNGIVEANAMMIPDLFPGRLVQFDSEYVQGLCRVEKAHYQGETMGDSWGIALECQEV